MVIKFIFAFCVTLFLMGYSFPINAQLPTDPSIVHGHAVIDTAGNHMNIINTPNTILDWQSFSIGTDSSVYFQQQNADSMILNRVTGNDPSHLLGNLGSNGHIWLINPYGVLFGEHARIDVASLVASTMDITNVDFLAKNYSFNSIGISGEIKNQGEIRASFGGHVWLMGNRVQNEGLIQTPGGHTAIAAGKSVEFVDSGAPNVVVRVKAPENEVVNLGSLVAQNGQVDLHSSIVNQQGIVRANSVNADEAGRIVLKADQVMLANNSQTQADHGTVQMEASSTLNNWGAISGKNIALNANEILQQGQITAQGGNVALLAKTSTYLDGVVDVSNVLGTGGHILLMTNKLEGVAGGTLRADGEQGGNIRIEGGGSVAFSSTLAATGNTKGGAIEVTGDRLYLLNADIDASGGTQGGTVHLGGGWQGSSDLSHAREVLVGVGSEVKANGRADINPIAKGGEIAVWSTQNSEHYGSLQAKNGGRIEFSSQGVIKQTGDIQVGIGGTVLFDPKNLFITENPPKNFNDLSQLVFSTPGDSYITPAIITDILNAGAAVTLQANNDITVQSAINVNAVEGAGDLTLQAGRNITFDASISTDNGNLTAIAGDPSAEQNNRDPGTATLTIAANTTLDVRFGTVTLVAVNGNFINNNGDAAISISADCCESSGRWLIYANAPTGSDRNGFSNYTKHYNQVFVQNVVPDYATSGNWFFYSIAPELKVSAPPNPANLTYGEAYPQNIVLTTAQKAAILTGFIDGDTVGIVQNDREGVVWNISGALSTTRNITAGIHDVSYVSGLSTELGYQIVDNSANTTELNVTPRTITATGFTASDKIYDGNNIATITGGVLNGVVSNESNAIYAVNNTITDDVSLSGTGKFDSKNVGVDKLVILTNSSLAGVDSKNYVLDIGNSSGSDFAAITPLTLNVGVTNIIAADKTYDRTTDAKLSSNGVNFITGDDVSLIGTGTFDTRDAGNDKIVTFSRINLALLGGDSGNYLFSPNFEGGSTTADIVRRDLSVNSFAVNNKVYDGNTTATLVEGSNIPQGVIDGDQVFFSAGSAAFDNKNVGIGKTVTITGIGLSGPDVINYQLSGDNSAATATANITVKDLLLNKLIADNKIYDGNVNANVNGTLSGLIEGDAVSLTKGTGVFDNKNVGINKIVTLTGGELAGADSNNYKLGSIENLTALADITPKKVTVSVVAEDKIYDGNTNARISGSLDGLVAGDSVSVIAKGFFDSKDTGTNKQVTVSESSLSGIDSGNYEINENGAALANIAKALLFYRADEATRLSGAPIIGLSGRVTGFVSGDNQANATTGNLVWSTPATESSPVGNYAILGDGLSARNYSLINDEKNFTALHLVALAITPSLKQVSTDTSIQAVNTADVATRSAIDSGAAGRVIDATGSAMNTTSSGSFGHLSLSRMSFSEMRHLIDIRKEFKDKLFSDAVSKLEIDPRLSDVMVCTSARKEDLNNCRITEDQKEEIKSKLSEVQQHSKQKSIHKVRVASIPQIERKIIVLFGIDQYVDSSIPSLQSAVSDIGAVSQIFKDKLGYDETRIVKNATRADIIRTLNELAIEMEPNDSVVIYYAGHGYMNEKTGNGYWIPSDASAKNPQSWISNTSISEMLANINSKQMAMISDSCYSGAFTKEQKVGLNVQNIKPDDILGKRSVVVMASGGDEPVSDEGRGGHSIFAWFLMQAIQNVENWKIGTNIFEQVQKDVKKSFPQVPQYGAAASAGHQEGGDYLFEFRQLDSVDN